MSLPENILKTLKILPSVIERVDIELNDKAKEKLNGIINGLQFNQFVTIFDVEKNDFTFYYNLELVTGYQENEFTEYSFNNRHLEGAVNKGAPIIYAPDLVHFQRFACLLYLLISSPDLTLKQMEDYAVFNFRMYNKNGRLMKVEYKTFLFETNETGIFKSHIDIWTLAEITNADLFNPSVQFHSKSQQQLVNELLKEIKAKLFGFSISSREADVYRKLKLGYTRKEVGDLLNISEGTVNTHFNNIKSKLGTGLFKNGESRVTNLAEIITLIEAYQLA